MKYASVIIQPVAKLTAARENRRSVGNFSGRVRHGDDELAVNPSDGKQQGAADHEAEHRAQSAAPRSSQSSMMTSQPTPTMVPHPRVK